MGVRSLPIKLYRACRRSPSFHSRLRLWQFPSEETSRFLPDHHGSYLRPSPIACNYCITSRSLCSGHVPELGGREASRVFFLDTLALVRKLEAQGFNAQQAEAITFAISEALNDCLNSVAQSFVSKSELQKSEWLHETSVLKLKTDVQISQDNRMAAVQRDIEKLRTDIEKLRSEMRFEMDKVSAGQRLDLNLERGRMTEELAKQSAETSDLTNKLNKEIHSLKTQLEASKFEVIKYCIGTIVSVIALGLGVLRVFK